MSNKFSALPLQKKVAMTLLLTITAFAAISYLILSKVITPAFSDLELSAAKTDLVRAERSIDTDLENLEAVTADWAPWDDIYEYVNGRNPGFEKSNLNRPTLSNLNLDMMAVYAVDSELMWDQFLFEGKETESAALGILGRGDAAFAHMTRHSHPDKKLIGLARSQAGP